MRYLITGITGSIGAHIAKALLERGDKVVGIAHDKHPNNTTATELLDISDKLTMAYGDILDLGFLKRVMSDYEIEFVIHCAALPIVRIGNMSPLPVICVDSIRKNPIPYPYKKISLFEQEKYIKNNFILDGKAKARIEEILRHCSD